MTASSGSWVRRIIVAVFLIAIAVQVGVFLALRKKKADAPPEPVAASGNADAAPLLSDAAPVPVRSLDAAAVATALDAAPAPIDAAVVVRAEIENETPAQRRRRERREAREEAKRLREEKRREEKEREAERERQRLAAARAAETGTESTPAESELARVTFLVSPAGASLAVDGLFVGKAPLRDVQTSPGVHTLAASAPGHTADTVQFSVRAKQKRTVRLTLVKTPTKSPTEKPPVTVTKRPATPRVSGLGDASRGRSLIGSKCNACHRARGARSVSPRSRRRGAWERFFKNGYHDRYERLGGLVSRSQLAAIKAYLMANAKCDGNVAGERCK